MVHLKAAIVSSALAFGLLTFFPPFYFFFYFLFVSSRGGANCFFSLGGREGIIATLGRAQVKGFSHDSYLVNWNVPASGDDLYVQISSDTSHGWAATGIGSQMKGALMFVICPAGDG